MAAATAASLDASASISASLASALADAEALLLGRRSGGLPLRFQLGFELMRARLG